MKRPSITFDKEAILQFLLAHGEKIGVAVVAALACGLVWGGVNAARTKAATRDQMPSVIEDQAKVAAANIDKVKQPPAQELRRSNLAKSIEPWRKPDVQQPPPVALLNKPLFEEKSKRSKPEVFPIEELQAVAGVAFMPERQADAAFGRNPADVDAAGEQEGQPGAPKRRRTKREQAGQAGRPQLPPGFNEFGPGMMPMEMMMPGVPGAPVARGRLVPYCVVTGLIPIAKQAADYQQRYERAGLSDPQRDMPLWSDYLIERMVVSPGGREDWKRIDLKQFYADAAKQWAGVQGEQLPPGFMLGGEQNPGAAFGYCSPLPALAGDPWGLQALHPWFVGTLKEMIEEQAQLAAEQAEQSATILPGQQPGAGPAFGPPGGEFGPGGLGMGPGMAPEMPGMAGMAVDGQGRPLVGLDYRLFRFVDTTVEVGKTYRYRVRLSLWNPNRDLEPRYLTDAALAKDVKLPSAPSNVTEPVTVPDTGSLLVRTLRKAELKRFKAGSVEVLVLDKAADTGNYALRSLITEPGGLINVDKRLNKPGDQRTRGEDAFTDAVLIDLRGRQDDRAETRGGKGSPPPEPLDMLFLRPDGTFAVAAASESQPKVDRYLGTLPAVDDPRGGKDRQPAGPNPDNPFGSPFKR